MVYSKASEMTLIGGTDLANVCGMDEDLTNRASFRIFGATAMVGRGSKLSAQPGQNDGFSDGFLTKSPVDTCHSG